MMTIVALWKPRIVRYLKTSTTIGKLTIHTTTYIIQIFVKYLDRLKNYFENIHFQNCRFELEYVGWKPWITLFDLYVLHTLFVDYCFDTCNKCELVVGVCIIKRTKYCHILKRCDLFIGKSFFCLRILYTFGYILKAFSLLSWNGKPCGVKCRMEMLLLLFG